MDQRAQLRVSDAERQAAVDHLRRAHDEGRLGFLEYDERLAEAYGARTYADLDRLLADLPDPRGALSPAAGPARAPAPAPARAVATGARGAVAGMPVVLKILWTVWLCGFGANLVIWTLVSLGNGRPDYFWPMWLLVPGTVLGAVTVGVGSISRSRGARRSARSLPGGR